MPLNLEEILALPDIGQKINYLKKGRKTELPDRCKLWDDWNPERHEIMVDKKKYPEHKYLRNATKNSFVFPQFYGDYYANNAQGFCNSWLHLPLGRWKPGTGPDMPDGKLSDHMISKGIKSYQDFEDHMKKIEKDFWGNRFRVYQKWKDTWVEAYQKKGFFDMYTGFRCSGIMKKNEVINYPVQGAAIHC